MSSHFTEGHNIIERMRDLHPIHRELFQRYVARAEMSGVKDGAFNGVDWEVAIELVKSSVRILIRDLELPEDFWENPPFSDIPKEDRDIYIVWLQWNVTPLPKDVLDPLMSNAVSRQFCDNEAYDQALAAHNDAGQQETERKAKH